MRRLTAWIMVFLFVSASSVHAGFLTRGSFSEEGGFERRYIPPLTNILFNESPYITTEVSLWYWYQEIPDDSITAGGHINLGAAQARLALTDRLAFIATKDGYADFNFGTLLTDTHGFANIAAGLKYALVTKPEENYILTGGVRYEIPMGDIDTTGFDFQGHGSGLLDIFLSSAKHWDKFGLQGNLGTNIAIEEDNTTQMHYSIHADYELFSNFFPVLEFNGITTIKRGDKNTLKIEGHDVLNLGSGDSGTTLTAGVGFRYVLDDNWQVGAAWEKALARDDLIDHRTSVNLLFAF